MRIFLQSLVVATLILAAYAGTTVFGQDCKSDGDRIVCTTSEKSPAVIGPIPVPNSSKVVIRVKEKSPFDDCSLGPITFAPIKESDPIAAILQALAKASGGSLAASQALIAENTTKGNDSESGKLLEQIKDLDGRLGKRLDEDQDTSHKATLVVTDIDAWFASPSSDLGTFNAKFDLILGPLNDALKGGEPSIDGEQATYTEVKAHFQKLESAGVSKEDKPFLDAARLLLDEIAGQIATIKINADALAAARVQLRALRSFLTQRHDALQKGGGFDAELFLPIARQSSEKTTITCTNAYSKIVVVDKLPVEIDYEKDSDLTVSVGILLSTTPKQKLGIVPQKTGVDANGVPTFKNVFGVVDRARTQIVPFSFLNYRLPIFKGSDPLNRPPVSLHLSLGVGVNSNSGSNEVEYFAGAAVGFKKYFIQFGDHIGRFQKGLNGGFALGDTVPANFPSTLPINKVYKHGFGIAISYKLPL